MKFTPKYLFFFLVSLLMATSCSYIEDLSLEEDDLYGQQASSGEFTKLSNFDTRLMDLTGYLLSAEQTLKKGNENGIEWQRLVWDSGYLYSINGREYIIVPFVPDNSGVIQCLVAKQKGNKFNVLIRESSGNNNQFEAFDGVVDLKSPDGNKLCSQLYEKGKLVTDDLSSLPRLKSTDIEYGGVLLDEIEVTAQDLSNCNTDLATMTATSSFTDAGGYTYTVSYDNSGSTGGLSNSYYNTYMQAKQSQLTITNTNSQTLAVSAPRSSFIADAILVQQPGSSGYMYTYSGYWVFIDAYLQNQSIWIENNSGNGQWYNFKFDTPDLAGELTHIVTQIPVEISKLVARYALPIEDGYILWTGVDFDGLEQNRWWAAGGIVLAFIPETKAFKPVSKIGGNFTRFFAGMGDELIEIIVRSGVPEFTDDAVRTLAKKATKNATKTKVMLGKFEENGISYVTEAGTDYCYYTLDNWSEVTSLVNNSRSEMWKINKQFLDDMYMQGKEFFMSHDPDLATDFFKQEVDYIRELPGFIRFEKIGNYWKAVFN